MKQLPVMIASVLLGVCVTACAGAGGHTSSTSPDAPKGVSAQGYLNDGDAEDFYDSDSHSDSGGRVNPDDTDGDSVGEYNRKYDNGNYRDGDDRSVLDYGHSASAADGRAVTAVVERFYAAAAARDPETACSLMVVSIAKAAPENYSQAPGPSYLYGGKTCRAVMSRMFKYLRSELSDAAVRVTGVRVKNNRAIALLGSNRMSASEIFVRREGGDWKIDALLGNPLP
jgi:hypothetical protein